VIAALIGAVFCTVSPGPIGVRAAAGAVLVLSLVAAGQTTTDSFRDLFAGAAGLGRAGRPSDRMPGVVAGLMLLITLAPEAYEAARQAMLAVYARSQARRLGDRTATGLGGIVAIAYPAGVIGLSFDQALQVLVLLAKSILIALGGLVLLRVWTALRVVRD
jgi:hypothetical protein